MTHMGAVRRAGLSAVPLAIVAAVLLLVLPAVAGASPPAPTVTIVGPGYIVPDPPLTEPVPALNDPYVLLYLDDAGMGADFVRFSNDGGTTWSIGETFQTYISWSLFYQLDMPFDGLCTVTAQFSADGGTTWGPTASATTLIDEQSPVLTASDGYWNNRYAYTVSVRDQIGLSGVWSLWYRVDAGRLVKVTNSAPLGTTAPLKTSFKLAGKTGTAHSIDFAAVDYAGNYSGMHRVLRLAKAGVRAFKPGVFTTAAYVVIDRSAPVVKARGAGGSWERGPVTVSFVAWDRGGAGVCRIQYSVTRAGAEKPGAWSTGDSVMVARAGKSRVWFRAVDAAQPKGNISAARSVVVKIR